MFFFHSFTDTPYCLTLPYLLQFKIPLPDNQYSRRSQVFFPSPTGPPGRPCVAIYVSRVLNQHLSCSTVFHNSLEMLSVDVFSPEGLFGSPHRSLRVISVYLLHTNRPPYRSIPPERLFSFLSYPDLVFGGLQPPSPTCACLLLPLRMGIYCLRALLRFCF